MRYRYRLWCTVCATKDDDTCFENGEQLSDQSFETEEEAEEAGKRVVARVKPWNYSVMSDEESNEKIS